MYEVATMVLARAREFPMTVIHHIRASESIGAFLTRELKISREFITADAINEVAASYRVKNKFSQFILPSSHLYWRLRLTSGMSSPEKRNELSIRETICLRKLRLTKDQNQRFLRLLKNI